MTLLMDDRTLMVILIGLMIILVIVNLVLLSRVSNIGVGVTSSLEEFKRHVMEKFVMRDEFRSAIHTLRNDMDKRMREFEVTLAKSLRR